MTGFASSRWWKAIAVFVALAVLPASARAAELRAYFFGNSLVYHAEGGAATAVPHWLALLAKASGKGFAASGQWGFLRNFAADLPPIANWSFANVTPAFDPDRGDFASAGISAIVLSPANFIQGRAASAPYEGDNPDGQSPLGAALALVDALGDQAPGAVIYLYEGWPDMGPFAKQFPPDADAFAAYRAYATGDFHRWHLDFVQALKAARPGREFRLIPVSSVVAKLVSDGPLAGMSPADLYIDDAPHGTPALYLLAAMVTYSALYGEAPAMPPGALPLPGDFTAISAAIAARMGLQAASAPPAESPLQGLGLANPSLAMGLDGISDWSPQHPFIDLMKTARPWIGHRPGQWGGMEADAMEAGGLLDANGWPLAIPDGIEKLETMILTDRDPATASLAGRYRLTYRGEGELRLGGRAANPSYGKGEIRFDFTPGDGPVVITILSTDPGRNGNHIRDISVIRADQIELSEAGAVFNPDWLAHVADLRSVRFMDWMFTNGSTQAAWADRPQIGDYSYARRGVPVEVMLALANRIGADPWFNMPHLADDDYIRRFAEAVRDGLNPDLKAHVEYSNELWNFIFPQTIWARAEAARRWPDAGDDGWMQLAGGRAAEMAAIWAEVFGDAAAARLVRVVAVHTGWPGLEAAILEAPLWVGDGAGRQPPASAFDAYAVTGYFGYDLGSEAMAPTLGDWLRDSRKAAEVVAAEQGLSGDAARRYISDHRFDLAIARAETHLATEALPELLDRTFPYHAGVAARHGLRLVMYEGGTHVTGLGAVIADDEATAFFTNLNYSPAMARLYQTLLTGWRAAGGTQFNAYVDIGRPSKWGSWGAIRHLDDTNPRADVLAADNREVPGWWEVRTPDAFTHGGLFEGSDGPEVLAGSEKADILLGRGGDDILIVAGDGDLLHGGAGHDIAVLAGRVSDYRFVRQGERLLAIWSGGQASLFDIEVVRFTGGQ
ncbi:MAG: calcium-binding protein [Rhodobacteraceae bacterium]|nr:calcium-binding protein [Paracoccaceae bacterium]